MNEFIATVRARIVERGAALLAKSRRRVLIAGLTCFGTGAVLVGLVVWSSRYLPFWVVAVTLGLCGLCAAYGLERGARRRPRRVARDAQLSACALQKAEASGEREERDSTPSSPIPRSLVVGDSSAHHRCESGDLTSFGQASFTLGALLGVGLAHVVEELRAKNRGPR